MRLSMQKNGLSKALPYWLQPAQLYRSVVCVDAARTALVFIQMQCGWRIRTWLRRPIGEGIGLYEGRLSGEFLVPYGLPFAVENAVKFGSEQDAE